MSCCMLAGRNYTVTQLQAHRTQTDGRRKRVDLRTTLAEKFTMESTS